MKLSDGLFLESYEEGGRRVHRHPDDERIVDAACMQLVMSPRSSTCW